MSVLADISKFFCSKLAIHRVNLVVQENSSKDLEEYTMALSGSRPEWVLSFPCDKKRVLVEIKVIYSEDNRSQLEIDTFKLSPTMILTTEWNSSQPRVDFVFSARSSKILSLPLENSANKDAELFNVHPKPWKWRFTGAENGTRAVYDAKENMVAVLNGGNDDSVANALVDILNRQ